MTKKGLQDLLGIKYFFTNKILALSMVLLPHRTDLKEINCATQLERIQIIQKDRGRVKADTGEL